MILILKNQNVKVMAITLDKFHVYKFYINTYPDPYL